MALPTQRRVEGTTALPRSVPKVVNAYGDFLSCLGVVFVRRFGASGFAGSVKNVPSAPAPIELPLWNGDDPVVEQRQRCQAA